MTTILSICIGVLTTLVITLLVIWRSSITKLAQEKEELLTQKAESDKNQFALTEQNISLINELNAIKQRFAPVVELDTERQRVLGQFQTEKATIQAEVARIRVSAQNAIQKFQEEQRQAEEQLKEVRGRTEGEINVLKFKLGQLQTKLIELDEEKNLQEFGFYKPHYDFSSSIKYQNKLEQVRAAQKEMIKSGAATNCAINWTVNGSESEGRKQINQTFKLLLRAFNGECDAAVAKVKYNNIAVMETRIKKAYESINKLAAVQQCTIVQSYLQLKLEELRLAHEYQEKVQEEKEEQRRIREQMREEEIAQREIDKAKQEAEREEQRYQEALLKARQEANRAVGDKQLKLQIQIEELEKRLAEAQANKERAISRAQMTRSGHVYVISNIGLFGEHVYKIGMTRRLEPMDRVKELGDASVPFQFDVHAIIYSDDAPTLENTLHKHFNRYRVNGINQKKEFFRAT